MLQLVRPRRRRTLRRAFSTDCQAVHLTGFRLVGERILDLSPRGALLACDGHMRPGDEVILSFRAPHQGPWVDVVGEVRRVIEGWRDGDPGYCAGLRFTDIDRDAQGELLVRLAGFPPPVPSRRPPIDYAETVKRIGVGLAA